MQKVPGVPLTDALAFPGSHRFPHPDGFWGLLAPCLHPQPAHPRGTGWGAGNAGSCLQDPSFWLLFRLQTMGNVILGKMAPITRGKYRCFHRLYREKDPNDPSGLDLTWHERKAVGLISRRREKSATCLSVTAGLFGGLLTCFEGDVVNLNICMLSALGLVTCTGPIDRVKGGKKKKKGNKNQFSTFTSLSESPVTDRSSSGQQRKTSTGRALMFWYRFHGVEVLFHTCTSLHLSSKSYSTGNLKYRHGRQKSLLAISSKQSW